MRRCVLVVLAALMLADCAAGGFMPVDNSSQVRIKRTVPGGR